MSYEARTLSVPVSPLVITLNYVIFFKLLAVSAS